MDFDGKRNAPIRMECEEGGDEEKENKKEKKKKEKRKEGRKGEIRVREASRRRFTLRAFLPHSSCARRREKVNSDVEKQIRSLESRPRRLLLSMERGGEERKLLEGLRSGAGEWERRVVSVVRASSRRAEGRVGKKFVRGAICGVDRWRRVREREVIVFSI